MMRHVGYPPADGSVGPTRAEIALAACEAMRGVYGWASPVSELPMGVSLSTASPRIPPPKPEVMYPLDLDVGEVALGYRLIARSVSLTDEDLYFEFAFAPERTEEARKEVWLNMFYDADISPPDWNYVGVGEEVQYARPPLAARYAWFDFFPPDFVWEEHLDARGPDSDYLRNRISRLTVDLNTGEAHIES
jgi:hypothetical protein